MFRDKGQNVPDSLPSVTQQRGAYWLGMAFCHAFMDMKNNLTQKLNFSQFWYSHLPSYSFVLVTRTYLRLGQNEFILSFHLIWIDESCSTMVETALSLVSEYGELAC
jgi:hypothetical protein